MIGQWNLRCLVLDEWTHGSEQVMGEHGINHSNHGSPWHVLADLHLLSGWDSF